MQKNFLNRLEMYYFFISSFFKIYQSLQPLHFFRWELIVGWPSRELDRNICPLVDGDFQILDDIPQAGNCELHHGGDFCFFVPAHVEIVVDEPANIYHGLIHLNQKI